MAHIYQGLDMHILIVRASLIALLCMTSTVGSGVEMTFSQVGTAPAGAAQGLASARAQWQSVLTDDVQLRFQYAFEDLPGHAGEARIEYSSMQIADFYGNMTLNMIIENGGPRQFLIPAAYPNFPATILTNYTSDNPNGIGSPQFYLDTDGGANNQTLLVTKANLRAMGRNSSYPSTADAILVFDSKANWDFDRSDGLSPGALDFVGAAMHEIGHSLGFVSGLSALDTDATRAEDGEGGYKNDDSYRMTPFDVVTGGNSPNYIDWTIGQDRLWTDPFTGDRLFLETGPLGETKYSHWNTETAEEFDLLMGNRGAGSILNIGRADLLILHSLGWHTTLFVPEPSGLMLLLCGAMTAAIVRYITASAGIKTWIRVRRSG